MAVGRENENLCNLFISIFGLGSTATDSYCDELLRILEMMLQTALAVGRGFEPPIVQGNNLLCLPIPPPYIIALINLVSPIPPPTLGIKFRERKSSNSLSTLSFPN